MILYWPEPSVVADRVFSIRAGLATSTVTPGSTAPDVSFTVPAIVPVWADATTGNESRAAVHTIQQTRFRIAISSSKLTCPTLPQPADDCRLRPSSVYHFRTVLPAKQSSKQRFPIFRIWDLHQ